MAEEKEAPKSKEDEVKEALELQRMLGEAEAAETAAQNPVARLLALLLADKKRMIIAAAALGAVVIGVALFFMLSKGKEEEVEDAPPAQQETKAAVVDESKPMRRVGSYKLEPFYLALTATDGDSPNKFVSVGMELLLSNQKLDRDIDNNLDQIRRNIYTLLQKKKTQDYLDNPAVVKERLKVEIVTIANTILTSGAGSVSDVFFTEFVVK